MYQCRQCAGAVFFDPASQMVRCRQCGTTYVPEELNNSRVQEDIDCFRCQDCGAQLMGTDESEVGFCPYCGSQGLLPDGTGKQPMERIIPFQISREQCQDIFRQHLNRVPYLPRSFREKANAGGSITNFTGIYVPFHNYTVHVSDVTAKGKKIVEHHARYDVEGTFSVDVNLSDPDCQVPFDASRYLDDEISRSLAPFDEDLEKPFHPSYLAGFYADSSTVPANVYAKDAVECVKSDLKDRVNSQIRGKGMEPTFCGVSAELTQTREALYPTWFLTWRNQNRIAYAAVNGQSGKVVTDLPVSFGAFAAGSVILFLILFILLEMFFQPTPELTSVISVIASCVMAFMIRKNVKTIADQETHANDKGFFAGESRGKKKSKAKTAAGISGTAVVIFLGVALAVFAYSDVSFEAFSGSYSFYLLMAAPFLLGLIIFSVQTLSRQKLVHVHAAWLSAIAALIAGCVNAALLVILPAHDMWFYMGNALCIFVLIFASVLMLRLYNLRTTRPIPHMSDRREVGQS